MNSTNTMNSAVKEKCERFKKIASHNMKAKRQKLGLTQEQLAEKVNLSAETIGKLETQKQWFSLESLVLIADALKTTPCQLFLDTEYDHLIPVAEVLNLTKKFEVETEVEPKKYRISNSTRS